jgi:hypothetical protein
MIQEATKTNAWKRAKGMWTHAQLNEPRIYSKEEKEGMGDEIACIDMVTKQVSVDEKNLEERLGLDKLEFVESHEVGHHKMCPYDLHGFVRLVAHAHTVTKSVKMAQYVENLFADLMVNTHLHNKGRQDVVDSYRKMSGRNSSRTWQFYMSTFEQMLQQPQSILSKPPKEEMRKDAEKIGDIMRKTMYNAEQWPDAVKELAKKVKKYMKEDNQQNKEDSQNEQQGNGLPSDQGQGDEGNGLPDLPMPGGIDIPQSGDEEGKGIGPGEQDNEKEEGDGSSSKSGKSDKDPYQIPTIDTHSADDFLPFKMDPAHKGQQTKQIEKELRGIAREVGQDSFTSVVAGLGLGTKKQANTWFYRDLAAEFSLDLPRNSSGYNSSVPRIPEKWRTSDPVERLNVEYSLSMHGVLIPNHTTYQIVSKRIDSCNHGNEAPDLLIALDSSGSMPDPQEYLSFPVLGAMIAAHAALDRGKKVAVVNFSEDYETLDFTNESYKIDELLTLYFEGGTVIPGQEIRKMMQRHTYPAHILIISDTEITNISEEIDNLEYALKKGSAGGTIFIDMEPDDDQLQKVGFDVQFTRNLDEIAALTLDKARALYDASA